MAYGSYAQAVITRKQNIRASIDEVDAQAAKLRADLEAAFAELKKFELMEERRVKAIRVEREKREQAAVDDMAQRKRAVG